MQFDCVCTIFWTEVLLVILLIFICDRISYDITLINIDDGSSKQLTPKHPSNLSSHYRLRFLWIMCVYVCEWVCVWERVCVFMYVCVCYINDQSPARLLFWRVGGSVHPVTSVSTCQHRSLFPQSMNTSCYCVQLCNFLITHTYVYMCITGRVWMGVWGARWMYDVISQCQ